MEILYCVSSVYNMPFVCLVTEFSRKQFNSGREFVDPLETLEIFTKENQWTG